VSILRRERRRRVSEVRGAEGCFCSPCTHPPTRDNLGDPICLSRRRRLVRPTREHALALRSLSKVGSRWLCSYEDNGDAVTNLIVTATKTGKSSIEEYGSPEKFLAENSFLLGKSSQVRRFPLDASASAPSPSLPRLLTPRLCFGSRRSSRARRAASRRTAWRPRPCWTPVCLRRRARSTTSSRCVSPPASVSGRANTPCWVCRGTALLDAAIRNAAPLAYRQ
jgi:hypothetical protein